MKTNIFNDYIIYPENRLAYETATSLFSNRLNESLYYVYGPHNSGKSYLLEKILEEYEKTCLKSTNDILLEYIQSIRTNSTQEFYCRFLVYKIIIIDDIHNLADKTETQEAFINIINKCLERKNIVLITGLYPPKKLPFTSNLIYKIISGITIEIKNPDIETKWQLAKHFIDFYKIKLPQEAIDYIVTMSNNIGIIKNIIRNLKYIESIGTIEISFDICKKLIDDLSYEL